MPSFRLHKLVITILNSEQAGAVPLSPVLYPQRPVKNMRATLPLLFIIAVTTGLSFAESREQTSLQQTSESGLTGWTQATHRHSSGAWMNGFLKIKTRKKEIKEFRAQYAFIIGWAFTRNDSCVVIQSQNSHGPYYWQLFDISTGKLLDEFFRSKADEFPLWVKDFTEPRK